MRTLFWITLIAISLLWAGCDPMELDVSDDDTGDDDTGDDDTGDDDTGDDDTGDDDIDCDLRVPVDLPTIQDALDAATGGEVICVWVGTYVENLVFAAGKDVHLIGPEGPAETIIDGNAAGSVVEIQSGLGPDTVLEGFTITNGEAESGGGVHVDSSSPTLRNLVVVGNVHLQGYGAGMYLHGSSPTISNVLIAGNTSQHDGGGIAMDQGSAPALTNVVLANNEATTYGGGIWSYQSSPILDNVLLVGNTAARGGGIYVGGGAPLLTNVTIAGNQAGQGGGVTLSEPTSSTLINVTVTGNSGSGYHDWFGDEGAAPLQHCNTWGNTPLDFEELTDPTGNDGNISADPQFLDITPKGPLDWDLHLGAGSLLIDAGDPTVLDPDGSPSDIGAYGGPGAGGFDLDLDGYFEWWLPGVYDPGTSPGMDCDDGDPALYPGSGC